MKMYKGGSLIEILLASALLIILMPALFASLMTTREGRAQQQQRIDSSYFLKETQEEVRAIRERGWDLFAINGTHHPERFGNTWALASNPESINGLTRQVVISDAYRDGTGKLSQSGTMDPSTKLVEITVSWDTPLSSSVESTFYMTRYQDNVAYSETLENDFLTGETSGTVVVNDIDGEIVLGSGGQGNWCSPDQSIVGEIDLPKQGVANAISAIEGQVIAGTGENASGVSLARIGIDNSNPPIATLNGQIDGYKTNDVFTEENYAYIGTDTNNKEIIIINTSSNPFSEVGYVNLPGINNADSVHVSGQIGLAVQGNILWSFDLSSKSGERPLLDLNGIALAGNGTEVIVVGNYAYVSLTGDIGLQIIDISDPTNLTVVAQANVDAGDAQDIAVNSTGTRGYLVTSKDATKREFFIIDTSTKSGNQPSLGSFDTGDMDPKAVIIVPGNRAIAAGHGGSQYQVINISQDNNPNLCGSIAIGSNINDVDAILESDGDAYSYVLTTDSTSELKIIEGGPGGEYSDEGSFESGIFDASYSTVFNRFVTTDSRPNDTDINYQIAVADDISGSCNGVSFSFVGPDGTNGSFFDEGGMIPLDDDGIGYENPGRCFRYKIFLSTQDSILTPIFEAISINYSP